jgi:hypothetical protein
MHGLQDLFRRKLLPGHMNPFTAGKPQTVEQDSDFIIRQKDGLSFLGLLFL